MRKEFTMTQEQCDKLLDACKPVPYMVIGGVEPRSVQENANAAWAALATELGFEPFSVRPVEGKGMEVFTAEVVQAEEFDASGIPLKTLEQLDL
jgi:hypothetical protein